MLGKLCFYFFCSVNRASYVRHVTFGTKWRRKQIHNVTFVALGQVFSEYFGSPPPPSSPSTNCSTIIIIGGWYKRQHIYRCTNWTQSHLTQGNKKRQYLYAGITDMIYVMMGLGVL
jgi:hypothetical protein